MPTSIIFLWEFLATRYNLRFRNSKQLKKYQEKKLNKQYRFIQENSEFYKNGDIPSMDKEVMNRNFSLINTRNIDFEAAMSFALKAEKTRDFSEGFEDISVGLSSGTSGSRSLFLTSKKEQAKWAGNILAKLLPSKILGHRVAFFMRANNRLYETVNSTFVKLEFFDMEKDIASQISNLVNLDPTIIIAPPAVHLEIIQKLKERKVSVKPLKIISIAEVLEATDERLLKEEYQVDCIHQVYQCTEGFLGCTCRCGTLHINEDIVWIEKEWIDDKRFIPIITDFVRTTQPIINYRLNDILIVEEKQCACKSPMLAIKAIEGREDDSFIFKEKVGDGTKVVYPDFIRRVVLYSGDVSNFKMIQHDIDTVECMLSPLSDTMINRINIEFEQLSNKMNFKMPTLTFNEYEHQLGRKLKRVERKFTYAKN